MESKIDAFKKHNPLWLEKMFINEDYFDKKVSEIEQIISECKMTILKFMIGEIIHLEAILPIISKYRFEFRPNKYYGVPMNELTIYLK